MAIINAFKRLFGQQDTEKSAETTQLKNLNVSAVLTAHLAWTDKLRTHITNKDKEGLMPDNLSRDDLCELGIWIYGDAKDYYGQLPAYTHLLDIHAQFHKGCGRCAAAVVSDNTPEANVHLKTVRHMSAEVQLAIAGLQTAASTKAA